ncbi:hypothetical protein BV25DRAFT_1843841, partial [Artomyces pyxidatus]
MAHEANDSGPIEIAEEDEPPAKKPPAIQPNNSKSMNRASNDGTSKGQDIDPMLRRDGETEQQHANRVASLLRLKEYRERKHKQLLDEHLVFLQQNGIGPGAGNGPGPIGDAPILEDAPDDPDENDWGEYPDEEIEHPREDPQATRLPDHAPQSRKVAYARVRLPAEGPATAFVDLNTTKAMQSAAPIITVTKANTGTHAVTNASSMSPEERIKEMIRSRVGGSTTASNLSKTVKIPLPDPYNGSDDLLKFEVWVGDLLRWMRINQLIGRDMDTSRIDIVGHNLSGEAANWYHKEVESPVRTQRSWTFQDVIIGLYNRF